MGRNDFFRIGVGLCVALVWAVHGINLRDIPLMQVIEVLSYHTKPHDLSEPSHSLNHVVGALSREMECAVMEDSLWGQRVPCCETESLHLTMREIMFRVEALGMVHTYEFLGESSGHFRIALRYGASHSKGRQLQFDFSRMGHNYYIQDIHGLCELFTYLSLAAREQSSSPVVQES